MLSALQTLFLTFLFSTKNIVCFKLQKKVQKATQKQTKQIKKERKQRKQIYSGKDSSNFETKDGKDGKDGSRVVSMSVFFWCFHSFGAHSSCRLTMTR